MNTLSSSLRLTALMTALLGLAACSGGGNSATPIGNFPNGPFGSSGFSCDPGTQVQLANPLQNQGGVSSNINQIEIVASGSNNTLYTSYQQWNVILTDGFGSQISGGPLNRYSDPNGPHPYQSDFYYTSSISGLPSGRTWTVLLNQNANCTPVQIGNFGT